MICLIRLSKTKIANTPLNSNAKAEVEIVEKANSGCNSGHLAQPLTFIKTSAAEAREEEDDLEEEKVEEDSEKDSIVIDVEGKETKDTEEEGTEEVTFMEEVRKETKKAEMGEEGARGKEKKTGGTGDHGSTDRRTVKVKATVQT